NNMQNVDVDYKITIIIKPGPKLLANANISFRTSFDWITIKGFQIWRSDHFNERLGSKINVAPPSKNAYGKYHTQVFFENSQKWYEIEQLVFDHFMQACRIKGVNISEDINPDEIP